MTAGPGRAWLLGPEMDPFPSLTFWHVILLSSREPLTAHHLQVLSGREQCPLGGPVVGHDLMSERELTGRSKTLGPALAARRPRWPPPSRGSQAAIVPIFLLGRLIRF